jgi:hypothetical protein
MSMSQPLPPSTIGGIKRLAWRMKKEQGIQHARALDNAAQQAGFSNYIHALRELSDGR